MDRVLLTSFLQKKKISKLPYDCSYGPLKADVAPTIQSEKFGLSAAQHSALTPQASGSTGGYVYLCGPIRRDLLGLGFFVIFFSGTYLPLSDVLHCIN